MIYPGELKYQCPILYKTTTLEALVSCMLFLVLLWIMKLARLRWMNGWGKIDNSGSLNSVKYVDLTKNDLCTYYLCYYEVIITIFFYCLSLHLTENVPLVHVLAQTVNASTYWLSFVRQSAPFSSGSKKKKEKHWTGQPVANYHQNESMSPYLNLARLKEKNV